MYFQLTLPHSVFIDLPHLAALLAGYIGEGVAVGGSLFQASEEFVAFLDQLVGCGLAQHSRHGIHEESERY